jgi:hypothetical protein
MEIADNTKYLLFPCSLIGKYIRIIPHKKLIITLGKSGILFTKINEGFVIGKYGICGIALFCGIDL